MYKNTAALRSHIHEMHGNRRAKISMITLSIVATKIENGSNNPYLLQSILCLCNADSGVNLVVQYLINILIINAHPN
jgi:hypothetical protein